MNNPKDIRIIYKNEYPFLLRQLEKLPKKLYVQGDIPDDSHKFLCVIGSRTHSQYGKDACKEIILGLRGSPVVIVSGLAIGIDSLAHEYALEAGLKTIAFPGSGLHESVLYPRSRIELARRIVSAGGTLMSPFDMNCQASRWTFPVRNSLMAGISNAILVIEAKKDSGTLITVDDASNASRDLLAVPGSIFSDLSYGPNNMLRTGATSVTCAEDVLEALGISRGDRPDTTSMFDISRLDKDEQRLLKHLSYPKMRDELIQELKIDASDLNALISSLELQGAVSDQEGMITKMWKLG